MTDTDFETMYREWLKAHVTSIVPPPIDEVRDWWHHAHRPPLAERIAEAAVNAWVMDPAACARVKGTDAWADVLAAVQRVLDDEGERA